MVLKLKIKTLVRYKLPTCPYVLHVPLLTFQKPPPMDLQINHYNRLVSPSSALQDASSSSATPRVQKRNLDLRYEDRHLFR
jgi:hypothetical protein